MNRLGTQKSGSRSTEMCLRIKSLNLEQIWSLPAPLSNGRFEGTVVLSASCEDEGKSFHQAPRNEIKATGRKVADSELNSPASRMNENHLMNAVKRSAHFSPFLQTSTSAGGTDSGLSGVQSSLTKGKVKGIIDCQGNIKDVMMGRARCGMWAWIFALVFFWNTHMLRAQDIAPYFKTEVGGAQMHLEGNRLVLTCLAEGSWPLEFKWIRNTTDITEYSPEYSCSAGIILLKQPGV